MPLNVKTVSPTLVALISGIALLGWWTDHAALAAWLPSIADMTFNTALSFLLIALACGINGLHRLWPSLHIQTIHTGAAIGVGLLASISLSQDIFGLNLGIDNLLFDAHGFDLSSPHPGRMSPVTALGFLLCATTLITLHRRSRAVLLLTHVQITLLGILSVVGIGMNIFMHDVPASYTHLASISPLTAVSFLLITTSLLHIFESHHKLNANVLLHSGIQLMYRLKYPQKFALISIIFIIPLAILMWDELRTHDQRIADAKLKIIGIEHIKETEKLAKAIPEHRGMSNTYLANPGLFATALQAKTAEVDRLFAENARMDRQHAGMIDVPDTWGDIELRWQQIKNQPHDALLLWHWHTEIIALLNKHLRDIGRQTRLSYDTDPAIHNQLSLQLEIMPDLLEQIGQLRGQGTAFLARKSISKQEQISLTSTVSRLKMLLSEATQLLQSEKNAPTPPDLYRAFDNFSRNCDAFIETSRRQLIHSNILSIPAQDYFNLGTHAIAQGLSLSQRNMSHIEQQLEQRINASITAQYNIKLMAMIAVLLLVILFAAFYRSVMNTISALDRVSEQMARGAQKEAMVLIPSSDEMGSIVSSFDSIANQLVQASKHMSAVVDYAAEAIITIDAAGIMQTFNPAAERIFGYTADEVIGSNITQLMPEKFRQRHLQGLQRFVQTGESHITDNISPLSVTGLKKDASEFPMALSISAVILDDQQMFVGMIRDTSQREMLENQLRHAQKMEAVGALVGGVAHNFNNMLAGIVGKAYMAKRKAQDRPELLSYLESIESISAQAGDMIKQLLTFAHKDFSCEQQNTRLDILIKESFNTSSLSIAEDIQLKLHIAESNLMVCCDANQVQQVLMNMMNNARDALAGRSNKQISVRLERCRPDQDFFQRHDHISAGPYACLSISDNGHGMDAETQARIFEPFYTTKGVNKGTGLGLSTAFGAITSHQGVIEVDSQPEHGTTFRIYLPLIEPDDEDVDTTHTQAHVVPSSRHETILLVDDEPVLLHSNKEVLEELGYKVIKARNGRQGLQQFEKHRHVIDIVVSDIVMPEMGGVDMVRQIRATLPGLPAIFITGYNQDQLELHPDELHHTIILTKPIQISNLSQHIESMLTRIECITGE